MRTLSIALIASGLLIGSGCGSDASTEAPSDLPAEVTAPEAAPEAPPEAPPAVEEAEASEPAEEAAAPAADGEYSVSTDESESHLQLVSVLKAGEEVYSVEAEWGDVTLDSVTGVLRYFGSLEMDGVCADGNPHGPGTTEWITNCWPSVQAAQPTLKDAPAPECRCDDEDGQYLGLDIYVTVGYQIDLAAAEPKPVPTGTTGCGCAS